MTEQQPPDRRRFLSIAGGTALLGALPSLARAASSPGASSRFKSDLELELRAAPDQVAILPGTKTQVWRYRAKVLHGDAGAVTNFPDSYLGPAIRVHRGTRVRIHFINELPQPSVVHWHGLLVPEAMDGHPRFAVQPGGRILYEFEVQNRAGTYWFHPHPHGHTAEQVYGGLAGLFIVLDDEERALKLPDGERDVALVIQDRSFTADNQLRYIDDSGMSGMMARMTGFRGEQVLVNGHVDFNLGVERKPYRLRLLNGSNSRIYKLVWKDGAPVTVIGSDGGLLEAPLHKPYVMLAPAERVELWVDCSAWAPGEERFLQSLPLASAGGGMMNMMGGGRDDGGSPLPILTLKAGTSAAVPQALPARLSTFSKLRIEAAANRARPRRFHVTMGGMRLGLNGRVFEMNDVARDEVVRLGSTEVWEFVNEASMGMMGAMPHPMHVHGVQFRVVGRQVLPGHMSGWQEVSEGYLDEGWKDTVLVMPGERVRVLIHFGNHAGLFLYHCHNLEHEDMGMMRNFLIKA